jgi:hypothetical protein
MISKNRFAALYASLMLTIVMAFMLSGADAQIRGGIRYTKD